MPARSQWLCEDVCRVVKGRDVMEFYVAIGDLVLSVVIVCVNVFSTVVTEIVLSKGSE